MWYVSYLCNYCLLFWSYRAERRERSKRGRFQDVAWGPGAVQPAGQADRTQISGSLTLPHTDTNTHARTHEAHSEDGRLRGHALSTEEQSFVLSVVVYHPPTSTSLSTLLPSKLYSSLLGPPLRCHRLDEQTDASKNPKHYTSAGQCSCRESRINRRISTGDIHSQPSRTVHI